MRLRSQVSAASNISPSSLDITPSFLARKEKQGRGSTIPNDTPRSSVQFIVRPPLYGPALSCHFAMYQSRMNEGGKHSLTVLIDVCGVGVLEGAKEPRNGWIDVIGRRAGHIGSRREENA